MNLIFILDAYDSDTRVMSALLTRVGYDPIIIEEMETASLGVVIVS